MVHTCWTAGTVDASKISRPKVVRRRVLAGLMVVAAMVGLSTVSASSAYAAVDTWTTRSSMPTARFGLATATAPDGKIYAIGGHTSGGILATVEAYDPATNTWAVRASMPTARAALATATGPDGKIYAIGGELPAGLFVSVATVEAYDPATNTWAARTALPNPRSYLGAATGPDGRIYAIGGRDRSNPVVLSTVVAYDPATNTWTAKASMPTMRAELAAATGPDGKIYAIGGRTGGGGELAIVEAYETTMAGGAQYTAVAVTPGVLSVNAAGVSVDFGTLTPGGITPATAVGGLLYSNTLDSGANWSVTVAATSLTFGTHTIPFTRLTFAPGGSVIPAVGAVGSVTPGGAVTFAGADTTPGTTFSSPLTIATAAATTQGIFTHSGSTVQLVVPGGSAVGQYHGTLQYTIIG